LRADGSVSAWGYNASGQANVPIGLSNVVAIAAGDSHSMALWGSPPGTATPEFVGPRLLLATQDRNFLHRLQVKNGASTFGANGLPAGLVLV
jgi:hypothetical protein